MGTKVWLVPVLHVNTTRLRYEVRSLADELLFESGDRQEAAWFVELHGYSLENLRERLKLPRKGDQDNG